MAVWDDALTEQDRKVVELRPPRPLTGFGERSALLVVDMNRGAVGEDRPIAEQLDRYPGACGNFAWDTLLITGNTTSGCIRATAIDGLGYEFKVAVIEECVFDRIEMSHKASLFDLQFKCCDVISVDRAYEHLATVHQGRTAATVSG